MAASLSVVSSQRWDAVVIGAGPAGAVTAAVLASRGMRTLLLERRHFPRPKVCGGCLAPAGVRALEDLGLAALFRDAPRINALRLIARRAELTVPIEDYVTIERSEFDRNLVRAACDRGATFVDGAAARVLPDDVVVVSEGRDARSIRPGIVVVADGLSGTSLAERPDFVWRVDARSPVGVGAILSHHPEHVTDNAITMVCDRGGYVGAAPLGRGQWSLAAALHPGLVRRAGLAGALAEILAGAGVAPLSLDRRLLHGVGNLTRRRPAACGRVLVVGDAAGYVQPLTGEGMSWAIACAARIGPHAAAAAAGDDAGPAWAAELRSILRPRRMVCRAVCFVAHHPRALAGLLRIGARSPAAGWASRRLCWSMA